jgi:predicted nucleic acid-binding protein
MARRPSAVIDTTLLWRAREARLDSLLPLLFSTVWIPTQVRKEVGRRRGKARHALRALIDEYGGFFDDCKYVDELLYQLVAAEDGIDQGEAEVIVQAMEKDAVALIDERRGYDLAARMKVPVKRTGDLLIDLVRAGAIDPGDVSECLDRLMKHGFRLSKSAKARILEEAEQAHGQ